MAEFEPNVAEEETEELKLADEKTVRLSLHIIVKRHLPKEATSWSQEKIINELNKIRRVRLDRENIGEIDSLELLNTEVTNLYLQSNKISCIQNLECLPNLQVLVLLNNRIKNVEGILHLQKLIFLDISDNCLNSVSADNFPKSVIILNLAGNPCTENTFHRINLIKGLPKIRQLDGLEVSTTEKIEAGVTYESSEDTEDDEEMDGEEKERDDSEETANTSGNGPVDSLLGSAYKQLPKIQCSIHDFATEMLMRSQKRLEEYAAEHKRHVQEITNSRMKCKIRPKLHLSKPQ